MTNFNDRITEIQNSKEPLPRNIDQRVLLALVSDLYRDVEELRTHLNDHSKVAELQDEVQKLKDSLRGHSHAQHSTVGVITNKKDAAE